MTDAPVDGLVDLVLMHVARRSGHGVERRLVLRRTVSVPGARGDAAAVEQLWISAPHPSYPALYAVLRGLAAAGTRLLRAATVPDLRGMTEPATVAELDIGQAPYDAVEISMVARGVLWDPLGTRVLHELELSYDGAIVGRLARRALAAVTPRLGVVEHAESDPADDENGSGSDDQPGWETSPPHPAAALELDLDDARTRVRHRPLWTAHRLTPLTLDRPGPSPSEWTGPSWSIWHRRPDGTPAPTGPPTGYVLVLIGVDGGTVGTGNAQYNLFEDRIEPTIDLDGLLTSRPVHDALAAFAVSGGDPTLRQAAIDAIRGFRSGGAPVDGLDTASTQSRQDLTPDGEVSMLGGTVLICDCRGVQVGDHTRQFNTFARVLTPTISTQLLLQRHPDLITAIVDQLTPSGGSGTTLQAQLSAAVRGVAETHVPRPPGAGIRPWGSIVTDEQAIAAGDPARQVDTHRFTIHLTAATVSEVRDAAVALREAAEQPDAEVYERYGLVEEVGTPQSPAVNRPGYPSPAHVMQQPDYGGPSIGGP